MRESGKMAVCVSVSVSVRDSEAVTEAAPLADA